MQVTLELTTPHRELPITCEVDIDGFYNNRDVGASCRDWDVTGTTYFYKNGRAITGKKEQYLDNYCLGKDWFQEMIINELEG